MVFEHTQKDTMFADTRLRVLRSVSQCTDLLPRLAKYPRGSLILKSYRRFYLFDGDTVQWYTAFILSARLRDTWAGGKGVLQCLLIYARFHLTLFFLRLPSPLRTLFNIYEISFHSKAG